eukprot:CAMPEP_0113529932 /NCGR_PEP_ID=MMETSP0015_2-20120614/2662_1 /TAXON_ID=2838 /ORGANISM="Odontella" /LENGTH=443 /DNA_ID=CAMNT_0000428605 /DNA_START=306 /DNA_END=1638 /DNA_ORIENTATION=- /assembly_acc=CAM_ASM_000160
MTDEFPLSFRCHRHRSRLDVPSGEEGAGRIDKSRVVGDVLKRFANRNHFGPGFSRFLDDAYQQQNKDSSQREQKTGNNISPHDTNREDPSSNTLYLTGHFSEEGLHTALSHPVHDDISDDGSPPSLADDDSKWTINYDENARDESKGFSNITRQCNMGPSDGEDLGNQTSSAFPLSSAVADGEDLGNQTSSAFPLSSAVAARASGSHRRLASIELTRGSPTVTSMDSIDCDHAIATLVSIFGSPWTAERLGTVFGYCKGEITDTIDTLLAHGDADPEDLIDQLKQSTDTNDRPGQAHCKTEHPGLEGEKTNAEEQHTPQTLQGDRLVLDDAPAPVIPVVSDDNQSQSDIPSVILPVPEKDNDVISLLSCSIAEGSVHGLDRREPHKKGRQKSFARAAPSFRSRHEAAIPRDDSFARLLVSKEWSPKFHFNEVMSVKEEKGHEC